MKKRKAAVVLAAVTALAILAGGCGSQSSTSADSGITADGDFASSDAETAESIEEETSHAKSTNDANAESDSPYHDLTPDAEGVVAISKSTISAETSYYNFDADGTTVQLIALAGADGTPHIAFNTCQSCNPSPQAYYVQEKDALICQNCGFDFAPEDVGVAAGGCNPMQIEALTEDDEYYYVPAEYLTAYAENFASWEGSVE